jgi:hypothetical protein
MVRGPRAQAHQVDSMQKSEDIPDIYPALMRPQSFARMAAVTCDMGEPVVRP